MRLRGLVSRLCLFALPFAGVCFGAAPLPQELGDGLVYLRIARSPADLPNKDAATDKATARILDLRGTSGDPMGIQTLIAWLQFQARPETPSLLLVDKSTDDALLRFVLNAALPSQLSFSANYSHLRTDIVVEASAEMEKQALEQIDKGSSVTSLLALPLSKPRMDEAVLLQEHQRGVPRGGETATTEPSPAQPAETTPPTDPVLTRARHIHQALRALRM